MSKPGDSTPITATNAQTAAQQQARPQQQQAQQPVKSVIEAALENTARDLMGRQNVLITNLEMSLKTALSAQDEKLARIEELVRSALSQHNETVNAIDQLKAEFQSVISALGTTKRAPKSKERPADGAVPALPLDGVAATSSAPPPAAKFPNRMIYFRKECVANQAFLDTYISKDLAAALSARPEVVSKTDPTQRTTALANAAWTILSKDARYKALYEDFDAKYLIAQKAHENASLPPPLHVEDSPRKT